MFCAVVEDEGRFACDFVDPPRSDANADSSNAPWRNRPQPKIATNCLVSAVGRPFGSYRVPV